MNLSNFGMDTITLAGTLEAKPEASRAAGSSTSKHASGEPAKIARDLAKLATLGVPLNVRVGFEALSWGRNISEYQQAWEVVELADHSNLGIVIARVLVLPVLAAALPEPAISARHQHHAAGRAADRHLPHGRPRQRGRRRLLWTANIWSLAMDMAPKNAVASMFGIGGTCSAIGGMFMTQLVGFVLTRSGNNYALLFAIIPAAYFIALAWLWVMQPRALKRAAA